MRRRLAGYVLPETLLDQVLAEVLVEADLHLGHLVPQQGVVPEIPGLIDPGPDNIALADQVGGKAENLAGDRPARLQRIGAGDPLDVLQIPALSYRGEAVIDRP